MERGQKSVKFMLFNYLVISTSSSPNISLFSIDKSTDNLRWLLLHGLTLRIFLGEFPLCPVNSQKKKKKSGVSRLQTTYLVSTFSLTLKFPTELWLPFGRETCDCQGRWDKAAGQWGNNKSSWILGEQEACKWFAGQYRYQPSQELLAYNLQSGVLKTGYFAVSMWI